MIRPKSWAILHSHFELIAVKKNLFLCVIKNMTRDSLSNKCEDIY